MKNRDRVELLLLAVLWGASFLFMRVAAPEFGPIALVEIRVAVAALFLAAVLMWRGGGRSMLAAAVPLTVVGAINSALPFTLFAYATLSITAGTAAVINASAPLFAASVAYFWLRDRLGPARVLGLIVGFGGVLVLLWDRISFKDDSGAWAMIAGLGASLAYGIAANYTKRKLSGVQPLVTATGSQIAATLLLLPLCVLHWPAVMPSLLSWLCAITLGIACTGIAYILYFRLIAHAGPAQAITVTYLVPVFGMLWGLVFLHEAITLSMVVACAVILLGTALATGSLAFAAGSGRRHSVSTQWQPLLENIIARISRGSIPVDGMYWLEPHGLRQVNAWHSEDARDEAAPHAATSRIAPVTHRAASEAGFTCH